MLDDESIVQLLSVLYSAQIDTQRWEQFLKELCVLCGASKAALIMHDTVRDEHRILAKRGPEIDCAAQLYESYYYKFDRYTDAFLRGGRKERVVIGEELWREQELLKSNYYNDFLKRYDILQLLGVALVRNEGAVEAVSLYRGPREPRFDIEQASLLKTVVPHLKMALETRYRLLELEKRVSDLEMALDSLHSAILLLNAQGMIWYRNKKARDILACSPELFIRKNLLVAKNPRENARIRTAINGAVVEGQTIRTPPCGALSIERAGKRALHLLVAPLPSHESTFPNDTSAIIFLDDPEVQPVAPAEVLKALYGLTPAESRLALLIVDGHSVTEAAELGQIGRETAKSQMSAVLAKTGTRRQGELIRLLSRLQVAPA